MANDKITSCGQQIDQDGLSPRMRELISYGNTTCDGTACGLRVPGRDPGLDERLDVSCDGDGTTNCSRWQERFGGREKN